MSGAIFRCQSKRESRGAKTTDATASVIAQWAGLSTTATAKFKEIYQFDMNIRKVRLGLLIFPTPKTGNGKFMPRRRCYFFRPQGRFIAERMSVRLLMISPLLLLKTRDL